MEFGDVVIQVIMYLLGVYAGWNSYQVFRLPKVRRRCHRMGIRRGLQFWARVVRREMRVKKETEQRDELG